VEHVPRWDTQVGVHEAGDAGTEAEQSGGTAHETFEEPFP
ncbi:MAG: hypothetical protein RLZZ199_1633, partial [Actinomycetota bacterium]|jgi:hypothetical protein